MGDKCSESGIVDGILKVFWGVVGINSYLFEKDDFFNLFLASHQLLSYNDFLMVNILPSLESIPQ